ncbi:MAG: hypothetical protein NC131_06195 [Roseburia sp.]|nr:hypothetical protein [Roseburia sp.]
MNKNVPLTLMGEQTPRVVIFKSESHKLCEAFNVADGKTILKGMPVALDSDGNITPYLGGDNEVYLGMAITDNVNPAYRAQRNFPVEVTVMVEAFAVVHYVSSAAITPGYVKPTANVVKSTYVEVAPSTTATKFVCIDEADAKGQILRVLVR